MPSAWQSRECGRADFAVTNFQKRCDDLKRCQVLRKALQYAKHSVFSPLSETKGCVQRHSSTRSERKGDRNGWTGNLLVDEAMCVRVADFGLARVMHDLHTLTGGLGTFQWMAPEVLAHQRYSKKADVYSFAIVLWECTARQVCDSPLPSPFVFILAQGWHLTFDALMLLMCDSLGLIFHVRI